MVFEDLTDGYFRAIGNRVPDRMTCERMRIVVDGIMRGYGLNKLDATAVLMIAVNCRSHYNEIDIMINQTFNDLKAERVK